MSPLQASVKSTNSSYASLRNSVAYVTAQVWVVSQILLCSCDHWVSNSSQRTQRPDHGHTKLPSWKQWTNLSMWLCYLKTCQVTASSTCTQKADLKHHTITMVCQHSWDSQGDTVVPQLALILWILTSPNPVSPIQRSAAEDELRFAYTVECSDQQVYIVLEQVVPMSACMPHSIVPFSNGNVAAIYTKLSGENSQTK